MTDQHFIDDTYNKIKNAILGIDDTKVPDIYAISFFITMQDDDLRQPQLIVGYNTISRWTACTPIEGQIAKWPIASSKEEAKWNFAFWLQNEELVIGGDAYNPVSDWVKELPFYYTDEEVDQDFEKTFSQGEMIQDKFISIVISHAKRLHDDAVIMNKFGRPIPIIVHELEYYDQPLNWTKEANPEGLASEFEDWVNSF